MFTPPALILQLSYALLVAAVLAPGLRAMRLLIALAALAGLGHALWTGDRIGTLWTALLLAAALIVIGRRLWEDGSARFSADEKAMLDRLFADLPQSRARHLIDQGLWLTGKAGDVLTREGEPVDHLYY